MYPCSNFELDRKHDLIRKLNIFLSKITEKTYKIAQNNKIYMNLLSPTY